MATDPVHEFAENLVDELRIAEIVRERDAADSAREWQTGDPPDHGYYIGAWRRGGGLIISELWFNQDANPHWWFSRGYTGLDVRQGQHYAVRSEVVAWMPLPRLTIEELAEAVGVDLTDLEEGHANDDA